MISRKNESRGETIRIHTYSVPREPEPGIQDEQLFNEEDFVCFEHTGRCFFPWKCPHAIAKEVLAREALAKSEAKVLEVANVEVADAGVLEAYTDWSEYVDNDSVKMLFENEEEFVNVNIIMAKKKKPLMDMLKSWMFLEAEVEEIDEEANLEGEMNTNQDKVQSDNRFNAEVATDVQAVDVEILEAAEDGDAKTDTNFVKISEEEDEEFENSVKMSQDSKKFLKVGEPTETSLESGLNVPMVTDWTCLEQLRPGLGLNEPMVQVWTTKPSLEQGSLLDGFKMVTNNSMFDPILLRTTVEEADSLMVSRKQVKTKDNLIMAKKKKEENIQVVRLISQDFVYFKPFLLQLPP